MATSSAAPPEILDALYSVIEARRDERPEGSYVVSLLDGGAEAMAAKVREEAEEVCVAAREEGDDALAREVADLVFHVFVVLASRGVGPDNVYRELARRFGIGGLEEKAARTSQTGEAAERSSTTSD